MPPVGALAGLTASAAFVNRALRETAAPVDDPLGGAPLPWTWRGYDVAASERGSGPTILLVHGIYVGASSYEYRLLAPLLARTHRVVAFDFIGCGRSAMPDLDYSVELFVEQIVDALGALASGPVTLVASSLGAAFAVRATTRAQDAIERLVLLSPAGLGGTLDDEAGGGGRGLLRPLLRAPLAGEALFNVLASHRAIARFLRRRVYADSSFASPETVARLHAFAHRPGARFVPAAFVSGALDCNVARDLPFIEAPVLVGRGERTRGFDPQAPASEYETLAREASVVVFPSAGLLPQEEDAAGVARAIREFVGAAGDASDEIEPRPAMASKAVPAVFKSYDVRGIYPSELNDDLAHDVGRAFAAQLGGTSIVVGRDMRPSGEALFAAFARGATEAGADVTDVGLVSTDALYFAVGKYGFSGGVMITASHNPAQYNGLKMTREEAQALSLDHGLSAIRDRIAAGDLPTAATPGTVSRREILDDFAEHCLSFVERAAIKPFKIAVDAGNGMAGKTVPHVFSHLPCEIVPLYFDLDGNFPNHPASPIEPENMVDLQRAVLEHGCDLGIAFDGDADRMFVVDEKGGLVGGDIVTALVGLNTLRRYPGAKILYNLICSRNVPEAIEAAGGIPVRAPVGHSLIKRIMREQNVVFGGEHSGHFYFRENWFADSGMIALLQCLEVFSLPENAGRKVSEIIAPLAKRVRSGEINSHVADAKAKLAELKIRFADATTDELDGITFQYPDWWMNVRPSNTEPLLRLNVEGDTRASMERGRDAALAVIRT